MKYIVEKHERYPTLYLDDGMWRGDPMGSEPAGFHEFDVTYEIPDVLVQRLQAAQEELGAAEEAVRVCIGWEH